jgi:hypothetical protein
VRPRPGRGVSAVSLCDPKRGVGGRARIGSRLAVGLAAGVLFVCAHASPLRRLSCPKPPVPSGVRLALVARAMRYDGLPMTVLTMTSARSRSQLLAWYRRTWTNFHGEPRYIVYPIGSWKVIAHKEGSCFFTVQLGPTQGGEVHGLLGISNEAKRRPLARPPAAFAPFGSRLLMEDSSDDGGKLGRTWVLVTHGSLVRTTEDYQRGLKRRGWNLVLSTVVRRPHGQRLVVMDWQKGTRLLHCILERSVLGSTSVVLTEIVHP